MITKLLIEGFTNREIKDIESIVDKKFSKYESDIEKICIDMIKKGEVDDEIKDVSIEVIESLFRTLWQRRGSWRGGLR